MIAFCIFVSNLDDGIKNGIFTFANDTKVNATMLATGLELKESGQT